MISNLKDGFEHWCGCDYGEDTNFNYVGPIAVFERNRFNDLANELNELKEQYDQLRDVLDVVKHFREPNAEHNPYEGTGEVLKQYVENLKQGLTRLREARNLGARVSGCRL